AAVVIGGEAFGEQNRALAADPAMVVGTPGRVLDQMDRGNIDPRNVEVLVLDEADRLLDMGFAEQIDAIVRQLPKDRQMQRFRDRDVQVLVATDLASRGLDVDGIARVVNFDVPPTAEDYLHRIGRTARAQRDGAASTFATVDDLQALRSIEAVIKQRIPS